MTKPRSSGGYKGAADSRSKVAPPPLAPSGELRANGPTDGRDASGRFTAGNAINLRHGRRSERHLARIVDDARDAIAAQRAEIVTDLGGLAALSRLQLDLLDRYTVACALLGWMEGQLLVEGVVTAKGRRRALHGAYVAQLDRIAKLAQALGLERRSRPIPTLAETISERKGATP